MAVGSQDAPKSLLHNGRGIFFMEGESHILGVNAWAWSVNIYRAYIYRVHTMHEHIAIGVNAWVRLCEVWWAISCTMCAAACMWMCDGSMHPPAAATEKVCIIAACYFLQGDEAVADNSTERCGSWLTLSYPNFGKDGDGWAQSMHCMNCTAHACKDENGQKRSENSSTIFYFYIWIRKRKRKQ
jgi:hypothetical protein